jgi:hypothetical protein
MTRKQYLGAVLIFAAGVTLGTVAAIDAVDAAYDRGFLEGSCNTYGEFVRAFSDEVKPENFPPECPQAANA